MISGLVSVSFRKMTPAQVLKLCGEAGLQCIEWGGDIHVPAGDISAAKLVASMSNDGGIQTAAYGSYFRLGQPDDAFKRNLEVAEVLGAPVLRIWAGTAGSDSCTDRQRCEWIEQLARISDSAKHSGITVAPEFHMNTLTDSLPSLRSLLAQLPEQKFYWQPRWEWPAEDRLTALREIGDRLVGIHVFTWRIENGNEIRLPLAEGETMWRDALSGHAGGIPAMLEFVQNDDPAALLRDAAVLKQWLAEADNSAMR